MNALFLSAGITVGFVDTNVTVFESDGVATLTVAISVPPGADPIETSFFLLVNTVDGSATAAGLSQSLEFDCVPIHFSDTQLPTTDEMCNIMHMHTHNTHKPFIHL